MNHTRTTAVGLEHPCPCAKTDFLATPKTSQL